jgi:uncharacterized lipoprotein YbaY
VSDAPHVTAAGLLTRAARARARAARPSTPRAVAADRLTRAAWGRVSRGTFRTARYALPPLPDHNGYVNVR